MHSIFIVAHTPRGLFSGIVNKEKISKEEADQMIQSFESGAVTRVSLLQPSGGEVLLTEDVLAHSVLCAEIR